MPENLSSPVSPNETLFRQVHPQFVDAGGVQTRAFCPTKKDKGELSVDLGSLITAECSFLLFTNRHGYSSCGVWPIVISKCQDLSVTAFHKSEYAHHSHGFVDFKGKEKKECRK
jgi:hypothetical protein